MEATSSKDEESEFQDIINATEERKKSREVRPYLGTYDPIRESYPSKVLDGLYLGNATNSENVVGLKKLGVTHILRVAYGVFRTFKYLEIDAFDSDDQNLMKYFSECYTFIEKGRKEGGVLIHCGAGISRSATVTIAYIMRKMELSYKEARKLVENARPMIEPNHGQLKQYEEELKTLKSLT